MFMRKVLCFFRPIFHKGHICTELYCAHVLGNLQRLHVCGLWLVCISKEVTAGPDFKGLSHLFHFIMNRQSGQNNSSDENSTAAKPYIEW